MVRSTTCFFALLAVLILTGTEAAHAGSYTISMLPMYSTEEINRRITPMAEYLSRETGLRITPVLASTFDQYSKRLANGSIDIGYENPYIYALAAKQHEVIGMAVKGKDGDKLRGIIITRSDSGIKKIDDIMDKKIMIVGYTAAGGYLSQKLTLLENDIDISQDCTVEESPDNKHENVILSVFAGDVDAGFIRESALHKVDDFVPPGAIRVLERTAWLPNWAFSINRKMVHGDREKIVQAIRKLKSGDNVLEMLKIKALRPATDEEYDPVRRAAGIVEPEPEPVQIPDTGL